MNPERVTQAAVSSKGGMESAPSRGNGVGRANGRGPVARASLDTRNMTQFTRLQPGKGADYDDVAQRLLYNVRPLSQVLSQCLSTGVWAPISEELNHWLNSKVLECERLKEPLYLHSSTFRHELALRCWRCTSRLERPCISYFWWWQDVSPDRCLLAPKDVCMERCKGVSSALCVYALLPSLVSALLCHRGSKSGESWYFVCVQWTCASTWCNAAAAMRASACPLYSRFLLRIRA